MTNDEAASILDPTTRWEALEKYERDYCLEGIIAIQAACDEACCLAVEALIGQVYTDPVYRSGGCYCRECAEVKEDGGYLWCRGDQVWPSDFCSRGRRKGEEP